MPNPLTQPASHRVCKLRLLQAINQQAGEENGNSNAIQMQIITAEKESSLSCLPKPKLHPNPLLTLQHGQCWQQKQQAALALNQIHGQADSHCLDPHKFGEQQWFEIHPSAAGTEGTAMSTGRLESGKVMGMGHTGSSSEDSLLWEAGSAYGSIRSAPHPPQRFHHACRLSCPGNTAPGRAQRLLHWVMECDGARQELDNPQPTTAARVQVFGQYFQTHGDFLYCSVVGQGLHLMVLVGPLQL